MINIYLQNESEWKLYEFKSWSEARVEFKSRNMTIAENCILDHPYLSNNIKIKSNSIILNNSKIHEGVVIGHNCLIREDCVVESNSILGDYIILDKHVTIQTNSEIGNNIHLGYRSVVRSGTILTDSIYISHHRFDNTISRTGNSEFHKGCFKFNIITESRSERIKNFKTLISNKQDYPNIIEETELLIYKVLAPYLTTRF